MGSKMRFPDMERRLRQGRKERQLTQRAFWKEWTSRVPEGTPGTSWGQCRNYMEGKNEPRPEVLRAMAEVLGVRSEWLATGEGERTEAEHQRKTALEFLLDFRASSADREELPEVRALREALTDSAEWHSASGLGQQPLLAPTWLRLAFRIGEAEGRLSLPEHIKPLWEEVRDTFAQLSPLNPQAGEGPYFDRFTEELWSSLWVPFGFLSPGLDPDDVLRSWEPDPKDPRVHLYLLTICHAFLQAAQIARHNR